MKPVERKLIDVQESFFNSIFRDYIECRKKIREANRARLLPSNSVRTFYDRTSWLFSREGWKIDTSGLAIEDSKHVFYSCEAISIYIDNLETLLDNFRQSRRKHAPWVLVVST